MTSVNESNSDIARTVTRGTETWAAILDSMVDDWSMGNCPDFPEGWTAEASIMLYAKRMGKQYSDALNEESARAIAALYLARIHNLHKQNEIILKAVLTAFEFGDDVANGADAIEWLKANKPELLTWDYEKWLDGVIHVKEAAQ